MGYNFPSSPATGQTFSTPDGQTYVWDGTAWRISNDPYASGVVISDTPPANPFHGMLWWEADSGNTFIWYEDGDSGQWVQFNLAAPPAPTFLTWPAGAYVDWAGATIPPGTRACYGQSLAVATYAALFGVLQYTYGGSGANFLLPDLRGRVVAGKDDMGGTSANRLAVQANGNSLDGDILGNAGGAHSVQLATGHMPAHVHAPTYSGSALYFNAGGGGYRLPFTSDGAAQSLSTTSVGSDLAHNNVQPTFIANKLITTGGIV